MMTSTQVVKTSVTTTENSPQDYTPLDDQTTLLHVTPGFKPLYCIVNIIVNIIHL